MTQKPSIGRIVHYVLNNGEHRPAVITKVFSDEFVNLCVFPDCSDLITNFQSYPHTDEPRTPTSVLVQSPPAGPDTWHWPERVD